MTFSCKFKVRRGTSSNSIVNPLVPGGNKRPYIFKQTCSFYVQVCLSMYDILLPQFIKVLIVPSLVSCVG